MHGTFPIAPTVYKIAILESSSCKSCSFQQMAGCRYTLRILKVVGLVGQIVMIIGIMVSDVNQ